MPRNLDDFYNGSGKRVYDLGLTDDTLVDVSEYIDIDALERETFEVSLPFKIEYNGLDMSIIKNIEIYTKLRDEMVSTGSNAVDSTELEDYRSFPRGFMQKRGVFYCPTWPELFPKYDYLRHSDTYQSTNDAYLQRYMLPICLPNGHVFTHMGYCPPVADSMADKYMMANIPWIIQGNMLGHLESLSLYPNSKKIYVCEGMMDAYRLSDVFQAPSLALLGSNLLLEKQCILQMLLDEGYTLVYVPDNDEAGQDKKLLESDKFSNIIKIDANVKDIDDMVKSRYLKYIEDNYYSLGTDLDIKKVPVALIPEQARLEINEGVKRDLVTKKPEDDYIKPSRFVFNQLLHQFRVKNVV